MKWRNALLIPFIRSVLLFRKLLSEFLFDVLVFNHKIKLSGGETHLFNDR